MGKNHVADMTVVDHLTELRKRIIWVLIVLVVSLILGLACAGPVMEYVKKTSSAVAIPTVALAPTDIIRVYMQFAFMIALIVTLPAALYHVWKFVSPGLRDVEQRAAVYFIPAAFLLFVGGVLFGYFVIFPMLIGFMTKLTINTGNEVMFGIAQYFSFMFNFLIPFGLLFELPIIVMFLTRLRILNPLRLAKIRRVAYFVLAVIGFSITPPDLVSHILVTIPLIILYEISVFLSRVVYRKQLKEDEEWELQYGSAEEVNVD
ncbi:twin-arginine translocase subunit TatC [Brevibacillus sp. B_LB10_24]|uniref:twin-arginine translocase subunit TatC n=1 Tax=Brevibacillus sp. B_LB10_24 TaxID=3380645 RepID=UPI0038B92A7A